ncbi:MAG: LysR family transcriptional regulator [Deltaproteobacteria bacterium]|nr:LysR family transcriptional regulator [Deltaproteobacteria bacterium]
MINFNQLRIFYQAAKYQSCTVAAKKLFITQPAVTAQVKAFEDSCNLRLFKKRGRKIYLTDEGKKLYQYANQIFEYEKEIEDIIEDMRALKTGVLKLGTTKTYARTYMPIFITRFRQSYPHIKIHLNEGSSLEMANSLLDFQNEIAIIAKIEDNPQICYVPFCREDILVLMPPDHALAKKRSVTLAEIAQEPIIIKERGSGTRKALDEALAQKGIVPNISMETTNTDFIKQLVIRGAGISFLVKSGILKELEEGKLVTVPIKDCQIHSDVNLAYLRTQHLSTPAQAFLELLKGLSLEESPLQNIECLINRMAVPSR